MSIEPPKKTPRDPNISLQLITKYHPNGQKKYEGYYEEQEPVGDHTAWYENGNMKSEGCFEGEDGCVGKWRYWHSNGQLACIGILQGFRGDGLWTFWDETVNKIHEREYRDNELLDVWKNLRKDGCSDELIEKLKGYIFGGN